MPLPGEMKLGQAGHSMAWLARSALTLARRVAGQPGASRSTAPIGVPGLVVTSVAAVTAMAMRTAPRQQCWPVDTDGRNETSGRRRYQDDDRHPWDDGCVIDLARLVEDFAVAVQRADSRKPQAVASTTGRAYQPGIGPHTESQTIKLVTNELVALDQEYAAYALDVPTPVRRGSDAIGASARACLGAGRSRRRCYACSGTTGSSTTTC